MNITEKEAELMLGVMSTLWGHGQLTRNHKTLISKIISHFGHFDAYKFLLE